MATTPKTPIEVFERLRTERSNFDHHWQECGDYVLPRKSDITNKSVPGTKKMSKVFDSTAILANEEMASSLHALLTNPSSIWFKLKTSNPLVNEQSDVRFWLDDATRKLNFAINQSNFQTELPEIYLDLGCFGTGAMHIAEDMENIFKFKVFNLANVYLLENDAGEVVAIFRKFSMRIGEARLYFPLPQNILDKDNLDDVEFLQIIQHRDNFNPRSALPKDMPVSSEFWLIHEKKKVMESGFAEWPTATPRWTKLTGESYGRSPSMKSLPDIKMLNKMERSMIMAAEKSVNPPLVVNHKEVVLPVKTFPGGINYAKPGITNRDPIQTMDLSGNLPLAVEYSDQKRLAVRSAFFLDQLSLPEVKSHVTVPEFTARNQERLRKLGPVIGRLQKELLGVIVSRCFNIASRKGLFLPPPPLLASSILDIEYISPIANAQKLEEANSMLRSIAAVEPLAAMDPSIMDNVNKDVAFRDITSIMSMPQSWLNDEDAILAMRQQRAEQAAALREEETGMNAAKATRDMAQAKALTNG